MKQSRAAGRVTVSPAPHSSEARQSSLETSGNPSRSERDSKCVARSCRRSTPETFSGLSKRVRESEREGESERGQQSRQTTWLGVNL